MGGGGPVKEEGGTQKRLGTTGVEYVYFYGTSKQ